MERTKDNMKLSYYDKSRDNRLIIIDNIDREAEREAIALSKQHRLKSIHTDRVRRTKDYNRQLFDKLFKD